MSRSFFGVILCLILCFSIICVKWPVSCGDLDFISTFTHNRPWLDAQRGARVWFYSPEKNVSTRYRDPASQELLLLVHHRVDHPPITYKMNSFNDKITIFLIFLIRNETRFFFHCCHFNCPRFVFELTMDFSLDYTCNAQFSAENSYFYF